MAGKTLSSPHRALNISLPGCCAQQEPDAFTFLHGVAMNSLGDIYAAEVRALYPAPAASGLHSGHLGLHCSQAACLFVGQVSFTEIGQHQRPFPREMMSLRKWKRVAN